jgi:hypothetical protein
MTQSYRMEPSLDNAHARVRRAQNHLTRFKRERTLFFKKMHNMTAHIDMDLGLAYDPDGESIVTGYSPRLIPEIFSVLVGETVYNLRSALDYLVYELAFLDSRNIQKGTQFPIEDSPAGWKSHSRWLKGVSACHKTIIKRLQPFSGCSWTKILREVSNPDKHKTLTIVNPYSIATYHPRYQTTPSPPYYPMEMDVDITSDITFEDGLPVIETLQELKLQVANVLVVFNSEF